MSENIEDFIKFGVKENRRVYFTQAKELGQTDKCALKIASIISAFANSEGGRMYLGLLLGRKKVCGTYEVPSFISEEWFTNTVIPHIVPNIDNLSLHDEDVGGSKVFFINIPKSNNAPHRCSDKNYYTKDELGIRALEEHDIRGLYLKSNAPHIDTWAVLNTGGIPQLSNGKYTIVNFYPRIFIKNIGNTAEQIYKVELAVPTALNNQNFDVLQQYFSHFSNGYSIYSFTSKGPIFPNELAQIFEANFFVNADNFQYFNNGELRIKVYYSQGYTEKHFALPELLQYRHSKLAEEDFTAPTLIQ